MRTHTETLNSTSDKVTYQAREASQLLDIRTKEMKKIADESAELIERLKTHKSDSDLDSFVYQATFLRPLLVKKIGNVLIWVKEVFSCEKC